MEAADDPGPRHHGYCVAGKYHRLFANRGTTFDAKDNRTMGIPVDVHQSSSVRSIGSVLCRMGLLLPQPYICLALL